MLLRRDGSRLGVDHAEYADGCLFGGKQGNSRVKPDAGGAGDIRVDPEPLILLGILDNHDLIRSLNCQRAEGNISGRFLNIDSLRCTEPLPIAINE